VPVPLLVTAGAAAKNRLLKRALRWAAIGAPILLVGAAVAGLLFFLILQGGSKQTVTAATNGCVNVTPVGSGQMAALQPDQLVNAQTIVAVGRQHNVPPYGWVVGVATALQESSLHNLPYGDRDSLGLFQQRAGWAPDAERLDPAAAAAMFFTGGRGGQSGLLQIPNWQTMPIEAAAQAVQRSTFPAAYTQWQAQAEQIVSNSAVLSAVCSSSFTSDGSAGANAVAAGMAYLGTPYSWGGGTVSGPSTGVGSGTDVVGFDCSSLAQFIWAKSGVTLPRVTDAQAAATQHLPPGAQLLAGDLLFFHSPSDPAGVYHHVGVYDGQGNMLHAPRPNKTVEVVHNVFSDPYYTSEFALATRPSASTVLAAGGHG